MNMIYAQISNGTVVNCIVLTNTSILDAFAVGFDGAPIRIDNIADASGNPIGIGWTYASGIFTAQVIITPTLTETQIAENEVQACIDFFNQSMIQFAAQNILLGITEVSGATALISNTLATVQQYGQSGSLTAAIVALNAITVTSEMSPFLTTAVIANLISQTEAFLETL